MLRVGLAGGVGAGKSAVAKHLAADGIPVFDADRLAHELYAAGTGLAAAVIEEFGEGLRTPDGGVDRAALGEIVFADPERLAKLESMVHPPLLLALDLRFREFAEAGENLAVVEGALLPRWPDTTVDLLIGVVADPMRRKDRLRRRGWSEETLGARLAREVDDRLLRERCDWIVENNDTLEDLEWAVTVLARRLRKRAESN